MLDFLSNLFTGFYQIEKSWMTSWLKRGQPRRCWHESEPVTAQEQMAGNSAALLQSVVAAPSITEAVATSVTEVSADPVPDFSGAEAQSKRKWVSLTGWIGVSTSSVPFDHKSSEEDVWPQTQVQPSSDLSLIERAANDSAQAECGHVNKIQSWTRGTMNAVEWAEAVLADRGRGQVASTRDEDLSRAESAREKPVKATA